MVTVDYLWTHLLHFVPLDVALQRATHRKMFCIGSSQGSELEGKLEN